MGRKVAFIGLDPPVGKYLEIFNYVLRDDPEVKDVDLCCGLGFAKTTIAIQIAALTLNKDGNQRGLFLEPDWDRIDSIFLTKWIEHIPEELYTLDKGNHRIIWHNGSTMLYRPRVITGARERVRGKFKGIEFTFVIDDEAAIGFDGEQQINTRARVRAASKCRYYFTLSTPLVGPYGRFINRKDSKLFRGRTRDNHYLLARDPNYEINLRKRMSPEQARRELDGELVALEGRIWRTADMSKAWPDGTRNDIHTGFKKGEPWWLFSDFGSATGAYAVMQQMDATQGGRELFEDPVWVAVADLCPHSDASASRAFQRLKKEFGYPAGVVGGKDLNKRDEGSGKTISYFAQTNFGNVPIYPCAEDASAKQIQFDLLSFMMCSAVGAERRFTVARDFVSLDLESRRGILEMLDEDQWPTPDKRRVNDILPKNKEIEVQHIRDALLMGAMMVMNPPDWIYSDNPPA